VTSTPQKQSFFGRLAASGQKSDALQREKAQLEAFLNAVPSDYCGFAPDGTVAYSDGFCRMLGLERIANFSDIQNALAPSDAAALESLYARLDADGTAFTLKARSASGSKIFTLTGKRGADNSGAQIFDTLWLEDISAACAEIDAGKAEQKAGIEERDRLQTALDSAPMPLWLRDDKGQIVWCNRAYAAALDTTPATVIAEQRELPLKAATVGKNAATLSKNAGRALAQAALEKGGAEQMRAHTILGGKRRLVALREAPLAGSAMTLGSALDVTREEELETEQKRTTAANKELLEQLGTAIGIFTVEERLEFFNSAFTHLWGLSDQFLNTKPKLGDIMEKLREMRRLPEQADFRKFKQSWLSMFTRLIGAHEEMLYLPNGDALRMLVVPHPMGGLMMTFENVTSRLELESSYNTLIAVQKETLDNLAEGVAVYGGDGRLKLWNPAFAKLWGLNPEDLDGQPHITRLVERIRPRFDDKKWERGQKILLVQGLDRKAHKGRMECVNDRLIAYATMPLPDGGVLVTHADFTDTVRVENALRDKNTALETAERLKLDFLANVSYQLRTPLNAIMGFAEILSNQYFGTLNTKQREYTDGIHEAGARLASLIDDILDLSTLEAGYLDIQKSGVDVGRMLESLRDLTEGWARKEKIEIRVECPPTLKVVDLDERRIKQVLLNLIRNAIAHTPPNGTITLKAEIEKDKSVRIAVSDTGVGIAAEDQKRVFEPFERASSASRQNTQNRGGAGLGLTLVKNIVALHGGTVALESVEGTGTTVTIDLPCKMKDQ
jgi:signal transduction histidine kinase